MESLEAPILKTITWRIVQRFAPEIPYTDFHAIGAEIIESRPPDARWSVSDMAREIVSRFHARKLERS
jgi:hypothetical protein